MARRNDDFPFASRCVVALGVLEQRITPPGFMSCHASATSVANSVQHSQELGIRRPLLHSLSHPNDWWHTDISQQIRRVSQGKYFRVK